MDIWSAIKKLSHETGMPMTSVSKQLEHSDAYVFNMFGRGKCPSFDNANKVIRAYGYSICLVRQGEEPEAAIAIDETMDGRSFTAKERESAARKERERRRAALLAELERLGDE